MSSAAPTTDKQQQTEQRLSALRQLMAAEQLDAYLVPSVDEHINEYLPKENERRAWISGFTGSAGDFLITATEAWVFADSRYHEQADLEVALELIHVSKLGLEGQPSPTEKIQELAKAKPGFRLGFDPFTLTVQQFESFEKAFERSGLTLAPVASNLVDAVWGAERPQPLNTKVFALPEAVTGASAVSKLARVREELAKAQADVLPVTKLDQIAWLFNLRGQDISYNPLFIAYALVTASQAYLFTAAERIEPEAKATLEDFVRIAPYTEYQGVLQQLSQGKQVLIDAKHTTLGTHQLVESAGGQVVKAEHPVELLKAVKNVVEIGHMKAANLKASRGKILALKWLDDQLNTGKTVTEESFRQAIERLYAEEAGFMGLSFNTIAGAGANSSIVHYGTPDPTKELSSGEFFLIDSGCQFLGGTTDDTRTVIIGEPTTLQKQRYTEVLKAHINCAAQQFPRGTDGIRLDGIARATLWQSGLDYGHGTGHGVGAFLNVHEGPNGIHRLANKPFQPGMITSIEPGYYEPGWGGIRLENLYLTVKRSTGWYGFESLTYVPFDARLIDATLLFPAQQAWLKAYHQQILDKIGPTLSSEEQAWLNAYCTLPL